MELRQLQYFCQLSQCLSYREAAQRLFITPQALSKSIQSLEEELNVPLFDRNTRYVHLTKEGEYFFQEIQPILKKLDRAVLQLKEYSGEETTIRFGLFAGGYLFLDMENIHRFQKEHPTIHLDFHELPDHVLEDRILSGDLDIAFCVLGKEREDQFEANLVLSDPMFLMMGCSHPLAGKSSVTLEEIASQTLIVSPNYTNYERNLVELCREKTGKCPQVIRLSTDYMTICRTISEGKDISFASGPRLDFLRNAHKDLTFVACPRPICDRRLTLFSRKGQTLSPACRLLLSYLAKRPATEPSVSLPGAALQ